jgi:capsular polysaccharide transport system permease protein
MRSFFKKIFSKIRWLFVICVLAPTLATGLYFGFFASDVYSSESKFVVRSPERQSVNPLGALLRGAGFAKSQDDSYTVRDYILSRDALRTLNEKIMLDKAYSSTRVDVFSRFAGIDPDNSFEALHRFYQKMIGVQTDSTSSVNTLRVKAFTPEDAFNANRILLEQSEALVNRLNERGRQDLIKYASQEVEAAEERAKAATLAVSRYRSTQGVIDPERQATFQLQQIAKLQDELIASKTQLAQMQLLSPQSPQISPLQTRIKTIEAEIAKENSNITGSQRSLANKASDFQRLVLEADFANKQLASAMASLESARNEAQRKQVYLERIAQPSKPDSSYEPRRLRSVLASFLLGLAAWGILSILLAGVREHQD